MASLWSRQEEEEEEEEEEVGLLDFLGQDKCSSSSTTNSASSSRSSRTSSAGSANSSPRPLGLHLLDISQNVVDCTLSLGCAPSSASAPPPWRSCHDVSPSPGQSSPAPCYTPRQQPPRPVPISVYSNIPSTSAWGSPSPSRSPSPSPSPSSSQGGVGNYFIRICTNCKTTHTPLWRNGPHGPKSLCNACGIRYKKEGRRMRSTSSILHDEPLDRSNVNTTMAVVMPIVMDTEFDVVSIRGGKRWTTWPTTTTAINNNTTTCSCLDDDNENYKISLQQRFASAFPL